MMSCNTVRTKDGGVMVTIDRPEISLNIIFGKDGQVVEMDHKVKPYEEPKKVHNEYVCKHRGEVTKTTPCCGGHQTRPLEIECKNKELPDRIPFGSCNSEYCKFYEV